MINKLKPIIFKAWQHKGLRLYGANTLWLFAEKAVRMLIGFVVGIYVARQLGPEKYGLLNYAISFVMLFACFSELGLNGIVVRELVKGSKAAGKLLGTAAILKFIGFLIMMLCISVALFGINEKLDNKILIFVIAGGFLFQSLQVIEFFFQAKVLSKYSAIAQILTILILSVCRVYLAYNQFPLIYFAALETLNMLLTIVFCLFFYILSGNRILKWRFDKACALFLLKESWPVMFSSGATIIHMQIDRVMLKNMASPAEVGCYSFAARIANLWYFVPVILGTSLFPAIVASRKISISLYYLRLRRLMAFVIWFAVFIALFLTISASFIIWLTGGEQYSGSVIILQLLSWSLILVFFGSIRRQWLLAEGLQKHILICSITGAVVNIFLNYLLIPSYGGIGSAISTFIAFVFTFLIVPLFLKKSSINNMLFWQSFYNFKNLIYSKDTEEI